VRFFTGAVGSLHSVPFFTATSDARHFGAGVSFQRFITKDFELDAVAAIGGAQRAYVEGVRYKFKSISADEAGGYAAGHGYFQADAAYSTPHLAASITHADYVGLTSFTSEGISAGAGGAAVFASAFQSPASAGQAIGASWARGPFATNVTELFSQGRRQFIGMETERYRHFVATQFIGRSAGQLSANFGGGYTGNTISGSVGYQEVFNPLYGFQRAMTIQVGIQLPRFTLHLNLDVLPSGISYSGWGNAYVRGPALASGQASQIAE